MKMPLFGIHFMILFVLSSYECGSLSNLLRSNPFCRCSELHDLEVNVPSFACLPNLVVATISENILVICPLWCVYVGGGLDGGGESPR